MVLINAVVKKQLDVENHQTRHEATLAQALLQKPRSLQPTPLRLASAKSGAVRVAGRVQGVVGEMLECPDGQRPLVHSAAREYHLVVCVGERGTTVHFRM